MILKEFTSVISHNNKVIKNFRSFKRTVTRISAETDDCPMTKNLGINHRKKKKSKKKRVK